MTGAPGAPATSSEPGMPASALPAPLREIGFDQNLDRPLPLDMPFRDEAGPRRPARRLLRQQAGRAGVRLLRLPDALHAGAERRCRARSTCCRSTPGKDFEIVTVSFDPRETPAPAAAKKAVYLRALQAAGRRRRLAFPDRRSAVDRAR